MVEVVGWGEALKDDMTPKKRQVRDRMNGPKSGPKKGQPTKQTKSQTEKQTKRPIKGQVQTQSALSQALNDFKQTLSASLNSTQNSAQKVSATVSKVEKWAGQDLFFTQLLCDRTLQYSQKIAKTGDTSVVDAIVQQKIVKNWANNTAAPHLQKIEQALLSHPERDALLILYLQLLQGRTIARNNAIPEQAILLRTGLATLKGGMLSLSSIIYAKVFDEPWIEKQLPGLTKPVVVVESSPNPTSEGSSIPMKLIALACGLIVLGGGFFFYEQWTKRQTELRTEKQSQQIDRQNAAIAQDTPSQETPTPSALSLTQLTLLGDTFSGYSTFRNGEFQAVLEEDAIEIAYADEFDQTLRAQKLNQGDADLLVTTLDQFLKQQPQGKIVGLLDRTIGADAVVLNTQRYPELKSLLDLTELVAQAKAQGEKLSIAYAADTPSEYLALVLDTQFDQFNLSDFELIPVADASEAWTLMQDTEKSVAIAVLWEPYVAQAQQKGNSVVLSSRDQPNAIVDVLVASDRLIEDNPEVLSRLLEKYYRRIDANARDATQLQTQIAEDGNLSVADASTIIEGINFFSATEAQNWLTDGTLSKRIQSTAAILTLSNQLAAVPENVSSLYTDQFVTDAADNTQALIDLIQADNPVLANKLAGKLPLAEPKGPPTLSAAQVQTAADIGNAQVRGQVSFVTGSAELTNEGIQTLNQLSDELNSFSPKTIAVRVIGHTSRTGDAASNQQLSERRAEVVAERLRMRGVELNVVSEGKGFSEPLPGQQPEDARNQRTEIRLVRVSIQ